MDGGREGGPVAVSAVCGSSDKVLADSYDTGTVLLMDTV